MAFSGNALSAILEGRSLMDEPLAEPRVPYWMDAFDNLTFDRTQGLWLPVKPIVALSVALFGWLR
jgi:hypothetical protein